MGNGYSEERVIYEQGQVTRLEDLVIGAEYREMSVDSKGEAWECSRIRILGREENQGFWVRSLTGVVHERIIFPEDFGIIKTSLGYCCMFYLVRI